MNDYSKLSKYFQQVVEVSALSTTLIEIEGIVSNAHRSLFLLGSSTLTSLVKEAFLVQLSYTNIYNMFNIYSNTSLLKFFCAFLIVLVI